MEKRSLGPAAALAAGCAIFALSSCATGRFAGGAAPWRGAYEVLRAGMRPLAASGAAPALDLPAGAPVASATPVASAAPGASTPPARSAAAADPSPADPLPAGGIAYDRALSDYLHYYGFDRVPAASSSLGWLEAGDVMGKPLRLAALRLDAPSPRGSVLLLHGYYSHSGQFAAMAARFLSAGWTVLLYDLPGHGLSDGAEGWIDDFSTYGRAVAACARYMEAACPGPRLAFGHSTGCSAILEYSFQGGASFSGCVLMSPLVRLQAWPWVKLAEALDRPLGYRPPRSPPRTRNPDYIEAKKLDWLGNTYADGSWVRALIAWNRRFSAAAPVQTPYLVVQGDADATVGWQWNMPALRKKLPAGRVVMVPGAGHQLPHEVDQTDFPVMPTILEWMGER